MYLKGNKGVGYVFKYIPDPFIPLPTGATSRRRRPWIDFRGAGYFWVGIPFLILALSMLLQALAGEGPAVLRLAWDARPWPGRIA
jgi:hypothetical protein